VVAWHMHESVCQQRWIWKVVRCWLLDPASTLRTAERKDRQLGGKRVSKLSLDREATRYLTLTRASRTAQLLLRPQVKRYSVLRIAQTFY